MTDTKAQIEALAESIGVDQGTIRWLAHYIARSTPAGSEDLLADSDWIRACTADWLSLTKRMNDKALRHPEQAEQAIAAQIG